MDSLTHIQFAYKLLDISDGNTTAAICSLFPQIDREPAYLHRMYAHPFFQICKLSEIGAYVYKTGKIKEGFEEDFDWRRFYDDLPRMKWFAQRFEDETHYTLSNFNPDKLSILIAYVSHTYQDIFNNPMQAFLPQWVYPSGKWELWSEIGSIDFRTILYAHENISALRKELFEDPIWTTKANGIALIRAMINRTASANVLQVPHAVADSAFASLELDSHINSSDMKKAEELLKEHEILLAELIRKYSTHPITTARLNGEKIRS